MKTITINVSEHLYNDFQDYSRRVDRTTSELIREAMELYRDQRMATKRASVLDIKPASVGKVLRPLGPDDDLLEEVLRG